MLVFSARAGDVIEFDDETRVEILSADADRVRVGVIAPDDKNRRISLIHDDADRDDDPRTPALRDPGDSVSSAGG